MDASGLIQSLKNNPIALAISVGLHLVIFIMLGISLSSNEVPSQKTSTKETVKAYVIDATVVEQEIKKLKQAEINKKQKIKNETNKLKRQLEKEKKRLANIKKEKKNLERKAAAKKKADKKKAVNAKKEALRKKQEAATKVEIKRLAKLKKQRDEAAAEKRRQNEEKELKRRMEEEERKRVVHNEMLDSLRSQYVRLIEQKVERNWLRPATVSSGLECEVFVTQSVLGDVINVSLGACASDVVFRNSIERAVRKSSPLPPPPNPEVFDRQIRFVFKPNN